jgi:hypothetical protein
VQADRRDTANAETTAEVARLALLVGYRASTPLSKYGNKGVWARRWSRTLST